MKNSNLNRAGLEMATVVASDGRQARMPAKFLANYTQQMIDSMVMQLHRGNPIDTATCNAIGMVHV